MPQILYLSADHAGFRLKEDLKAALLSSNNNLFKNLEIIDLSPKFINGDDYPLVAKNLTAHILASPTSLGIAFCGSGQGICIALNRFKGIRAGLADSQKEAKLLKEHNHAQILCMSGFSYNLNKKLGVLKSFLQAKQSPELRHVTRVVQLDNLTS